MVIDAGTYEGDVCAWRAHDLVLRGNGTVILKAAGKAFEQKAIWVIKGDRCFVEGIHFEDCAVPDNNGAGIRAEGTDLHVRACVFRRNQDGLLAGANVNSTIIVERCEFDRSGAGDGLSHAIYIGKIKAFIYTANYSHGTVVGHEVKSRALYNYIAVNRISTEDGTGSRNIDLPNGGESYILGNIIQHGATTENGNVIGYGLEGLTTSAPNTLVVAFNTIVNERSAATFFRCDPATDTLRVVNNIIAGTGTVLIGTATVIDTMHNTRCMTISAARFRNAASLDYELLADAPARSCAVDAGPLDLHSSYVHPTGMQPRTSFRDMGALESATSTTVFDNASGTSFRLAPNPASHTLTIFVDDATAQDPVHIYSLDGTCVMTFAKQEHPLQIDCSSLAAGVYIVTCSKQHTLVSIVR